MFGNSQILLEGWAASILKMHDFTYSTYAMSVSISMSLKPVFIITVWAFICHWMDIKHFKAQYFCGLTDGIQFNIKGHDL